MSALSLFRSVPLEQAKTSKPTIWRAITAGRLSAARAGGFKELLAALQREDYATAYALTEPLAGQGLAVAQLVLGTMYGGGLGVPRDDGEAAKWRHMAADQGLAEAQTILGVMYAKGEGVAQNDAKAAEWFRKAADQGHAAAQSNLGLLCAKGQGVAQNDAEAAKWFHKAADQGLAEAQTILGAMYVKGQGVAQSYVLAHMWFNLAAAQGDAGALANRDQLARMMTPAQIAEAQRLAQEWKRTT
jgi:TPR repeat protein